MSTGVPPGVSGFFKARSGAFKALVGGVGPITAILSTLLALGLISPFGGEDAIAKSLSKTRDASTSAVAIRVRVGAPADGADPIAYTGQGEFDHQTGYGRLFLDFSQTAGMDSASNVETILRGRVVFFRGTPGEGTGTDGGTWLRVDLAKVADTLAELQQFGNEDATAVNLSRLAGADFPDPSSALDFLERSSDLSPAGNQTVFGQDTRLYTGTLDKGDGRLRLSVWIDDEDLVRRVRISGGPEQLAFTISFRQFGVPVDARPPKGKVVDAVGLLDRELEAGSD